MKLSQKNKLILVSILVISLTTGSFASIPGIVYRYGHIGPVIFAVWSPDGSTIVSGGGDSNIIIWSVKNSSSGTGLYKSPLMDSLPRDRVSGLAWSSNGTYLAGMSWLDGLHIWNASYHKKTTFHPAGYSFSAMSWFKDGFLLGLLVGENLVDPYLSLNKTAVLARPNMMNGSITPILKTNATILDIKVNTNNQVALLLKNSTVVIINGTQQQSYGFQHIPKAIGWDNQTLVVSVRNEIRFFDGKSTVLKNSKNVTAFAFNFNHSELILGDEGGVVSVWNKTDLTKRLEFKTPSYRIHNFDWRGTSVLVTSSNSSFFQYSTINGTLLDSYGGALSTFTAPPFPKAQFLDYPFVSVQLIFVLIIPIIRRKNIRFR